MTETHRGAAAQPDLVGAGLVVLAAACFGLLGPLSRFAGDAGVDSLAIVTWRAGIGAAVVAGFIVARVALGAKRPISLRRVPVRDRWFMLAAAAANTILNLAAFIAFERITIALTLLVFYLYPAGVAVLSTVWFGDRLDRARWIALGISLAGMALVMAGAGALGELDAIGIGLAFLAALTQVFYVLAARHGFAHVPGPQAAALTMGGAFLLYLVIAAAVTAVPGGAAVSLASPLASVDALWPVLTAGIVGAGIPTVSFIVGIRRLGPAPAAILATFEPVVGVALAAWLLAETPTSLQLVGGAFILAAAVLLQLRPRGPVTDHEAVEDHVAGTEPPNDLEERSDVRAR
ncbi:MAG TPA: DMT family transporter [Candidatus Angelobacter sp.]|nr:DMT family transporter [Candidatus Angelobacter sp.]